MHTEFYNILFRCISIVAIFLLIYDLYRAEFDKKLKNTFTMVVSIATFVIVCFTISILNGFNISPLQANEGALLIIAAFLFCISRSFSSMVLYSLVDYLRSNNSNFAQRLNPIVLQDKNPVKEDDGKKKSEMILRMAIVVVAFLHVAAFVLCMVFSTFTNYNIQAFVNKFQNIGAMFIGNTADAVVLLLWFTAVIIIASVGQYYVRHVYSNLLEPDPDERDDLKGVRYFLIGLILGLKVFEYIFIMTKTILILVDLTTTLIIIGILLLAWFIWMIISKSKKKDLPPIRIF